MNKKILFLGPLYPRNREPEIKEKSGSKISNAPNVFQWNLLSGLHKLLGNNLQVINVLPVGIWKREYKDLVLRDGEWACNGVNGIEIGCINLPVIKQFQRFQRAKKILKKAADDKTEIIIYSAYMPFLKAAYRLPQAIKITAIVTDLPEFYDLGETTQIHKVMRALQNRMVYKYLKRVNRFVVLTKQMCEPLRVGERPWICIEGICNTDCRTPAVTRNSQKAILYSGTLHYRYGIKNLLTAFEEINDDIELWICGGGEAESEIRALVAKDKRIKFFGLCTQNEVAELRSRASILVNPRTNDGEYTAYSFPSKTMEYMTSGEPIVMYKLDGIPDEYDRYLNYVNTQPDYVAGLKSALLNVLENYSSMLEKAVSARQFVLEKKNENVQAKKILDFITSN